MRKYLQVFFVIVFTIIATINIYSIASSQNALRLTLKNVEAYAEKEFSSKDPVYHQITIGCGNVSFGAWEQWCCNGSKQKVCRSEECSKTIFYGCSEFGETDAN